MKTRSTSSRHRNSHSARSHRSFGSNRNEATFSNLLFICGCILFLATVMGAFGCTIGYYIYTQSHYSKGLSKRIIELENEADYEHQKVKDIEAKIQHYKDKADQLKKDKAKIVKKLTNE